MLETPARIEPCGFEEHIPSSVSDKALELQASAQKLGSWLNPDSAFELRKPVRLMNSYYSNLIEGHNTKPRDIERALNGEELQELNRPLALEGAAHIIVQEWIDELAFKDSLPSPASNDFIREVHSRFYKEMPEEFCFVEQPDGTKLPIVPGEFRLPGQEVRVGRHVPPSAERLDDFMAYFEKRYTSIAQRRSGAITAIPAAHHRLNYIHPFLDGNGRVSRLMSHAMMHKAGIAGHGLWSISRGLARGLTEKGEYKLAMDGADSPRMGDLDGRGNLSLSALTKFSEWFLDVANDQVAFCEKLFDKTLLEERYRRLITDTVTDKYAPELIGLTLRYGALPRGDAHVLLKTSERTARNTIRSMIEPGFLVSNGPKTSLRIGFPLDYRERIFPNLFGDAPILDPEVELSVHQNDGPGF